MSTMTSLTQASNQQTLLTPAMAGQTKSDSSKVVHDIYTDPLRSINSRLFQHLQRVDLEQLEGQDISCILPFLVKLLLNPHSTNRRLALKLVFAHREANNVINCLRTKSFEPHDLAQSQTQSLDARLFESASADERMKLVALEFIRIQDIARQSNLNANLNAKLQNSELFDNPLYVEEIISCLFALLNKASVIPVMNILDVSEALLHVKYGPTYIVRLVANMPERCHEVCQSLITFGEHQDECEKINEISDQRAKTLRALCQLNPSLAFTVRSLTLQMSRMPSLTIMITLDRLIKSLDNYNAIMKDSPDGVESADDEVRDALIEATSELETSFDCAISFMTGILLGADEATRTWFSQYIKSAQQKRIDQSHHTILSVFRTTLLTYVQKLFPCFLELESVNENSIGAYKVDKSESDSRFTNRRLVQAIATLRAYCALRGIGMLKLNQDEHETLLRLVTCRQEANQSSINLATTGVCTLLVCSSMINNQKDEKRAAEWLKWLIKESHFSDDSQTNPSKCFISELLLLIAIHFQNNNTNQIADLVHATLGLKLQAKFSVSKCKSLFVQEVFTDQMIAEHAVRVPVTKGLDNTIKEFLPIHCIHQLLESRSFSKHQVPIEDWIFKQICESKKPIHHMLPDLITAYVNTIMVSTSVHGHCGTNQPIPESKIVKIFQTRLYSSNLIEKTKPTLVNGTTKTPSAGRRRKEVKPVEDEQPMEICNDRPSNGLTNDVGDPPITDIEVAQILLLFYLMLFEDIRLREMRRVDISTVDKAKVCRYSSELMMDVPVFYLLQLVRDNQDSFGAILPPMLRLVAIQYPHLCSIQHWLYTTEHNEPYKSRGDKCIFSTDLTSPKRNNASKSISNDVRTRKITSNQLEDGFDLIEENPTNLSRVITNILMMQRDEIWIFVEIFIKNWTKVLNLKPSDDPERAKLVKLTTKLWWKFNTIFPCKLWVMTINSLRMIQNGVKIGSIKSLEYTWDELSLDPLIVLRCDTRVFRSPEYLNILLHILAAFLAASRRSLHDQINEKTSRQKDSMRDKNLEELKTTLVLAQTSAAIQILLESCLPTAEEQELLNNEEKNRGQLSEQDQLVLDRFEASISCICEHLHQVFIADTNLAKLVHFQTYPSELLATTSNKIPSMHICLDFIPELLSQPDLSKQVFVIELTSHLCEKYAITKSLNVAKLCFNMAYTLLQILPSEKRAQFFIPTLPALLRICKVFPILQEDVRIILNQINQISLAHLANTSSRLGLSTSKPFEGLQTMTWLEVKRLMNTLEPHEALYVCIQKCLLDQDQLGGNSLMWNC